MAIDDPADIELKLLRDEVDESNYLPILATKLGMSAAAAAALSQYPFVSQVVTSLFTLSPRRFEQRFVHVMEFLAERQKQIEANIPNLAYYKSEEFHGLLVLILERLHSTYQDEKLKTFGEALANSGTQEFVAEDKELYMRTLRELSLNDLQTLRAMGQLKQRLDPSRGEKARKHDNPSMARLAGFGLLQESTELKQFRLSIPVVPASRQSPELYAQGLNKAFSEYFKQATLTTYRISEFGEKFLRFIASNRTEATPQHD